MRVCFETQSQSTKGMDSSTNAWIAVSSVKRMHADCPDPSSITHPFRTFLGYINSGTPLLWTPWGSGEVFCIQWNPSIVDTFGRTCEVYCIERCPHFRGKFILRKHIWNTASVLNTEVSLFQGCPYEGFHCIQDTPPGPQGVHSRGVPLYTGHFTRSTVYRTLYQVPKVSTIEGFHCIQDTSPGHQGVHNRVVPLFVPWLFKQTNHIHCSQVNKSLIHLSGFLFTCP